MKNMIYFMLALTLLSGCMTKKQFMKRYPPTSTIIRTDSIINTTETIYQDTLVYIRIPGDTVRETTAVVVGADGLVNSEKSELKTAFASSSAWVQNSRQYHVLIQNDTLIAYELDNAIRLTWQRAERYYREKERVVIKEPFVPKFYKIMAIIAGILLLWEGLNLYIKFFM